MEQDFIKYAAAYLADTAVEAREKQADGLYEAAQKEPTKYTLMGAGLGALAGGAGGGLMSWLGRDKREEEQQPGQTMRDVLTGAVIGGGLGAGAGLAPSLIKGVQEGQTPPKFEGPATLGLWDATKSDVRGLFSAPTAGAGAAAGAVFTAAGLKGYRHLGLNALKNLSPEQAQAVLKDVVGGMSGGPAAKSKAMKLLMVRLGMGQKVLRPQDAPELLRRLVQQTSSRGLVSHGVRSALTSAGKPGLAKKLLGTWAGRNIGTAGRLTSPTQFRAAHRAVAGARGALKATGAVGGKGRYIAAALGLLLAALAAKKVAG